MSSSSSLVSSSSRSGEEKEDNENPPPTSILFGFQHLEERIINATTTTTTTTRNTNTQLPVVPSIIDIIGCDITIDDIQLAKQKLLNEGVDLKMDVNEWQKIPSSFLGEVTPLLYFCGTGNLLIIKLLFLIGADCTKLCKNGYWFPMLAAAAGSHLDICKWLFEYGGDAKYQINKETNGGHTPLRASYIAWRYHDRDNEGKTCRWLFRNGGGQHLSSQAVRQFIEMTGEEDINSNLLVLWMRENIQLHGTFMLLLCGTTTMITILSSSSPSSSETNDGGTRKHKSARKIHQERPLQILDGHPGIMEVIGDYVGLIRGKEFRMVEEFNESVIEYMKRHESSNDHDTGEDEE